MANEARNAEKAELLFKQEFNCSQSILAAFGPQHGLHEKLCLKLCTGFAGGMSYQGKTCGAVTGAYMAIGLINGNYIPNDEVRKEFTYNHIREFNKRFLKKYSSANCNDLLGEDISTTEGFETIAEKNLFEEVCPAVVKYAAEIVEELIQKTIKK